MEPWLAQDWQRLWLAARERVRPWNSLALVPAGPGATPEQIMQIAVTLSQTAGTHLGGSIHVADATHVHLADLVEFSKEITHCVRRSDLVLIALAAVASNVTTVTIAQSADCALLCAVRGRMKIAHAKRTVQEIGAQHFIGSALFTVA